MLDNAERSEFARKQMAATQANRLKDAKARKAEIRKARAERAKQPVQTEAERAQALADSIERLKASKDGIAFRIAETKLPVVAPADISISATRKQSVQSMRETLELPKGARSPGEVSAELVAKAHAPLKRAVFEKRQPVRSASPYHAGAKPSVADPLGQIVFGNVAPDLVLAKLRVDGHVSQVSLKTAAGPLHYLRHRVPNPISDEQYHAAEQFIADHQAMAQMGAGNTAAIMAHCENAVPETPDDRAAKERNEQMPYGTETHLPKDGSHQLVVAAFRVRRITRQMDNWQSLVLKDLLLGDMPVGLIAHRWGVSPDVASFMVRVSLWRLAAVYEQTDHEFRDWVAAERQLQGA